jgi:hypothetical protein
MDVAECESPVLEQATEHLRTFQKMKKATIGFNQGSHNIITNGLIVGSSPISVVSSHLCCILGSGDVFSLLSKML